MSTALKISVDGSVSVIQIEDTHDLQYHVEFRNDYRDASKDEKRLTMIDVLRFRPEALQRRVKEYDPNECELTIYVSDTALLTNDPINMVLSLACHAAFDLKGAVICGNAIVTGTDNEGATIDVPIWANKLFPDLKPEPRLEVIPWK